MTKARNNTVNISYVVQPGTASPATGGYVIDHSGPVGRPAEGHMRLSNRYEYG